MSDTKSPLPPVPAQPLAALAGSEPLVTKGEVDAGSAEARTDFNAAGYGSFVSDEQIRYYVTRILFAAARARAK